MLPRFLVFLLHNRLISEQEKHEIEIQHGVEKGKSLATALLSKLDASGSEKLLTELKTNRFIRCILGEAQSHPPSE